jgi:carboxyl-terminal processing protease
MKKKLLVIALAIGMSAHLAIGQPEKTSAAPLKPTASEAQTARLAAIYLQHHHYKPVPLDDQMSEKIFDRYFKSLDNEKLFFLQSDIDQFGPLKTKLDEAINNESLTLPFSIYAIYQRRFEERLAYARDLLKTKPDFTLNESYMFDREKAPWAKDDAELKEVWRKRVKNDWLRLKLAGKDDKTIREMLDKRYEATAARMRKLDSEDVFQIFMNAYAMSIEPHTNYYGPRAAEAFDIQMRLSLEGIGAVLQPREDYTVVRELVPGGPAALSGKLKVGDRIVGVGQAEGPIVDVLGQRIDDVVDKVRGPKDTVVRLDVLPADAGPDGKHTLVTLTRKKVSLEEAAAKKTVMEVKDANGTHRRVGIITLPSFYMDFEARRRGERDFKSATRDVAKLLAELKKDKVDNVLLDLRNNGGGSLPEAIELTGLFIDKGPVVQTRSADGRVDIESDTNPGLVWDGPLGVLINRGSASASEIFAAAIQDYGRGIIIGEPSFGKGTVQSLLPLDHNPMTDKPKFGELKMTIAQFFRINGGTTQLRGVTPDIKLPVSFDTENFGESSFENALPYTTIKPAPYVPAGDLKPVIGPLQKRHDQRVAHDKDFQFLEQDLAEMRKQAKEKTISLNEAVRRKERDQQEQRAKLREQHLFAQAALPPKDDPAAAAAAADPKAKAPPTAKPNRDVAVRGLPHADDGLQGDERTLQSELAAEKAAKDAKDIVLNEAAHILADEVSLLRTDTRMASRAAPYLPPLKSGGSAN